VRSFCPPFGVFNWAVLILFKIRQSRPHRADPQ
jgi:hypothetical protein